MGIRDIVFRGKRTDNGEWVEGYFNGRHIVQWNEKEVADYPMNRTVLVQTMIEIAADTLCQYTGLTDKHGRKIWEGDIVHIPKLNQNYTVRFEMGQFCIGMHQPILYESQSVDVVGNIFDNLEF